MPRKTSGEALEILDKKLTQLKAQKTAILNRDKEKRDKKRNYRLFQ